MRSFVVVALVSLAACRTSGSGVVTAKHPPVELPVVVDDARFYLKAKTAAGAELRMFVDTAGAMFLTPEAADRLRLHVHRDGAKETVEFPHFYDARVPRPKLEAFPVIDAPAAGADGTLGAPWFADRVFTFDYAGGRLWLRAPGDVPDGDGRVPATGGRIRVEIDGAPHEMTVQTGATVALTAAAQQALGGGAERAASFAGEALFARWRAAHPEWRVIEAAERGTGAPLIEVPRVTIAGHEIGPVWFTRRRGDDAAIGGSALRYFERVTVDWSNATAVFERTRR